MLPRIDKLEKYFWDHTQDASDEFKLRRLFEYASFPDLIKIPFDFVKAHIEPITPRTLRTSEIRKIFISRLKEVMDNCSNWDEAVYSISGLR